MNASPASTPPAGLSPHPATLTSNDARTLTPNVGQQVVMAVAPGIAQRMPESLSRWPMTALHPASTAPEPTNMPRPRKWA